MTRLSSIRRGRGRWNVNLTMNISESYCQLDNVSFFLRESVQFENRPTIVFLHDSLGCVQLWRYFPEKLCTALKCNMLIYDRQGYGKSSSLPTHHRTKDYLVKEADVLHHLLSELGRKNVILFGHSDGGSIALIAAGKYPSMVSALVVEAAHVFVEEVTLQGIRAAAREYANTNLRMRLEKYHAEKTETVFKAWTETWLSDDFRSWNIEHFLPRITCPLLFIQGAEDEYGTSKQMEAVSELVKGKVKTVLIPGVHHTPHKEAGMKVMEEVVAFLNSTPSVSSA